MGLGVGRDWVWGWWWHHRRSHHCQINGTWSPRYDWSTELCTNRDIDHQSVWWRGFAATWPCNSRESCSGGYALPFGRGIYCFRGWRFLWTWRGWLPGDRPSIYQKPDSGWSGWGGKHHYSAAFPHCVSRSGTQLDPQGQRGTARPENGARTG